MTNKKVSVEAMLFSLNQSLSNDISLRVTCKEDLDELALQLREEDQREMWACYRLPAREGLALCAHRSIVTITFLYRKKVCAVAGIAAPQLLGVQACVWSWTGREVAHCAKSFLRVSRGVLTYFQSLYPHLYAACEQHYTAAQRYLTRLGAKPIGKKFYLAGQETQFQWYQW
ncbi:MAG: hypothetical protein J6U96_04385 [Elusimicrobiaceae bacterium]|nr:hypothetical protein [Elusimicrobiaceae bacterium]